jgi:indolepyruvate ferredoxin oxidoreductase beta subunit
VAEGIRKALILALGGEGGGVLAKWLVDAALACGYPVQSTSIPGVAQRTGATSYYIECLPRKLAEGERPPVFCLSPLAGDLDLLVSTELLETARALERGLPDPDRTVLVSSSSRVLTVAEKMAMGDGRRHAAELSGHVAALHPGVVLFDMQAAARGAGTVVSAVMFGAVAATGVLGLTRAACEDVVRASGRGARASLEGFAAGHAAVERARRREDRARARDTVPVPDDPVPVAVRGIRLPGPVAAVARIGADRVADFQDDALAADYLGRVAAWVALEDGPGVGFPASVEAARSLALWMPYQDVIRVADLKSRPERFARIREDVEAADDEPVVVRDYLRPRVAEIADILPPRLAGRLLAWAGHRGRTELAGGFRLSTSRPLGLLAMRMLARLRPLRRRSSRFAREMDLVGRWDAALRGALASDAALALEIARLPRLLKGYGATHARGMASFVRILERLVEPGAGHPRDRARAIRDAVEAALADPQGAALARALGEPPPAPVARPMRIVRRPRSPRPDIDRAS